MKFKRALVSVSDKTGLVEFLAPLVSEGLQVVSTGGTAVFLKENGFSVIPVSDQTGFPEVMDGRVKTLHPHIHMCLLARDDVKEDLKILDEYHLEVFDLVIGNLYPFEQAVKNQWDDVKTLDMIDIGGPSFLRAAAKNYLRITTLCDPNDYQKVLEVYKSSDRDSLLGLRKTLAAKVFHHVSKYDRLVGESLDDQSQSRSVFKAESQLPLSEMMHHLELRYGENPQQQAHWFRQRGKLGLHDMKMVQGKALSYNNILDLDAAMRMILDLSDHTACVAVKHLNPCGAAINGVGSSSLLKVVTQALEADPVSVFGGVVAINRTVDESVAQKLNAIFLECVVAPAYTKEALNIFANKKNLRLLCSEKAFSSNRDRTEMLLRSVWGGLLLQSADEVAFTWQKDWQILGAIPDENTQRDLLMAWRVCAHLKSNAIAIVHEGQTVGLAMGQVNRVEAVEQALDRQKRHHPLCRGGVLASDAFFPFEDSIELIAERGIRWVIQPGGSIKDQEVISASRRLGINLILTGKRHFLH